MVTTLISQWLQPAGSRSTIDPDPLTTLAASPSRCPHCQEPVPMWPAGLNGDGTPLICTVCGGWADAQGRSVSVCTTCAEPHAEMEIPEHALTVEIDPLTLSERVRSIVEQGLKIVDSAVLTRYLTQVHERIDEAPTPQLLFVDAGDPLLASLPDRSLLIGLGTLAALEDEAQLAFLLAREVALNRAAWPTRRFAAAATARASWWQRWREGDEAALRRALCLSLRVGFGPTAESAADRVAIDALVRADYDPGAAARALRRLERASLAGRGARFLLAAERAAWLDEAATSVSRPLETKLNREVYRRVVGGFAVFARAV